jgi:dihydrofolate reductase
MGRIVACTNLTLDGVMQSPARPDEDDRDGFTHGGWGASYGAMQHVGQVFGNTDALLFGRRTYVDFAAVWPARPDSPFTPWLTQIPKYVASRSLHAPLPWKNSTLLQGELSPAVEKLKATTARDVLVLGSGELLQALARDRLVDEYVLLIHPLVLGSGRRLFADGGPGATLRLVNSSSTTSGVIVATYHPAT